MFYAKQKPIEGLNSIDNLVYHKRCCGLFTLTVGKNNVLAPGFHIGLEDKAFNIQISVAFHQWKFEHFPTVRVWLTSGRTIPKITGGNGCDNIYWCVINAIIVTGKILECFALKFIKILRFRGETSFSFSFFIVNDKGQGH